MQDQDQVGQKGLHRMLVAVISIPLVWAILLEIQVFTWVVGFEKVSLKFTFLWAPLRKFLSAGHFSTVEGYIYLWNAALATALGLR